MPAPMRPSPDATDADIARRIAAGAADAEAELVRRFAHRIRLYGLRHVRDDHRAADLVQDVLVIVLRALREGRVADLDTIDRFVLGTCRNVVHGWRRGERRWANAEAALAIDAEPIASPPPATDIARLRACLSRLATREQSILLLTFCEERSADEIGDSLGISAGNVRVVRHRALRHLRDCVTEGGNRA